MPAGGRTGSASLGRDVGLSAPTTITDDKEQMSPCSVCAHEGGRFAGERNEAEAAAMAEVFSVSGVGGGLEGSGLGKWGGLRGVGWIRALGGRNHSRFQVRAWGAVWRGAGSGRAENGVSRPIGAGWGERRGARAGCG